MRTQFRGSLVWVSDGTGFPYGRLAFVFRLRAPVGISPSEKLPNHGRLSFSSDSLGVLRR